MSTTHYGYDNAHPTAAEQHHNLSSMLDRVTYERFSRFGMDLTGKRYLEIGVGGSQIPRIMTEQVGPQGTVTAIDIDTRHTPECPGVTVLTHDIRTGPPPGGPWDLIHARLVLQWLEDRRDILAMLAENLTPGGVLWTEDWAHQPGSIVLYTPDARVDDLFNRYLMTVPHVLTAAGLDSAWAVQSYAAMRQLGLFEVDLRIIPLIWRAGGPGLGMVPVTLAQHRAAFLEHFTMEEMERLTAIAIDPTSELVVRGPQMYSTRGRRPA